MKLCFASGRGTFLGPSSCSRHSLPISSTGDGSKPGPRRGHDLSALPLDTNIYDLMIAAHGLSLGLTLVTNNVREFARVDGLRLDNWAE